jgi:hypothetical protein
VGVSYSGSTAKLAEHGGFAHDDANVVLLLSNPTFQPKTVHAPVGPSRWRLPCSSPWVSILRPLVLFVLKKRASFPT